MITLESVWEDFVRNVVAPQIAADSADLASVRDVFFAGAFSVLDTMKHGASFAMVEAEVYAHMAHRDPAFLEIVLGGRRH